MRLDRSLVMLVAIAISGCYGEVGDDSDETRGQSGMIGGPSGPAAGGDPGPGPGEGPDGPDGPDIAPQPPSNQNRIPIGSLDSVADGVARGWACDTNEPKKAIQVHIYVGGNAGSGMTGHAVVANLPSEAGVARKCGGGDAHRFQFKIPNWQKSAKKQVYAYGIDSAGGHNPELSNVPLALPAAPQTNPEQPTNPEPPTNPNPPTKPPEPSKPNPPAPTLNNFKPIGALDGINNGEAWGWACDQDGPGNSVEVHVYVGGPYGSASGYAIVANQASELGVNAKCGGGTAHRFRTKIPDWQGFVGKPVYVYALNLTTGGGHTLLNNAPQNVK